MGSGTLFTVALAWALGAGFVYLGLVIRSRSGWLDPIHWLGSIITIFTTFVVVLGVGFTILAAYRVVL